MPLTSGSPIGKRADNCYEIPREPAIPKIILANEVRFTLPTAFKMVDGFWKIRLQTDDDEAWRHTCNYEMPDISKEILQELWDFWDGKRKFNLYDAFYPASKNTHKHTGWPRYIPELSGMKKRKDVDKDLPYYEWQITIEGPKQRVRICNILRWQIDGDAQAEEPTPIYMKRKTTILKEDTTPINPKHLRCLCNEKH